MLYQECYTITEAVLENILAINGTLLFWKHGCLLIVYCTTIWGRAKTKRKMNLTTVEEASEIKNGTRCYGIFDKFEYYREMYSIRRCQWNEEQE